MGYSPRCEKAIEYAKALSGRLGHTQVTSGHLLAGVLSLTGGVGANVLRAAGLTGELVERHLASGCGQEGEATVREGVAFGKSATEVLARAKQEAISVDHTIVGVEHLVLALLGEESRPLAALFESRRIDRGKWRRTILEELRV